MSSQFLTEEFVVDKKFETINKDVRPTKIEFQDNNLDIQINNLDFETNENEQQQTPPKIDPKSTSFKLSKNSQESPQIDPLNQSPGKNQQNKNIQSQSHDIQHQTKTGQAKFQNFKIEKEENYNFIVQAKDQQDQYHNDQN